MKKVRITLQRPTFITTVKVAALVGTTWALFLTLLGLFVAITNPEGFFPGSTKTEVLKSLLGTWGFLPAIFIVVGAVPAYFGFWFLQLFIKPKLEFYIPDESPPEVVEGAEVKTDRGVV